MLTGGSASERKRKNLFFKIMLSQFLTFTIVSQILYKLFKTNYFGDVFSKLRQRKRVLADVFLT